MSKDEFERLTAALLDSARLTVCCWPPPRPSSPLLAPARRRRLEASSSALAALKRTTVLADVFRIWFDGSCGTISGLRLGRTAQQAVEWDEINAAWGQAVLLLATLARVRRGWGRRRGGARARSLGRQPGARRPPAG